MAKVDPRDYSTTEQRPKLTPEVLRNVETVVLTVSEAQTGIETADGRRAAFLVFEEYPEHAFWLNKTGIGALVQRLGSDDADWAGRQVPLVRVQVSNPTTGSSVTKYHVAPLGGWAELLASRSDGQA